MTRGRPLVDILFEDGEPRPIEDDARASYFARNLAQRRRRATFACEVCGEQFEAWARATQTARTCSGKCRVKLHRQTTREERPGERPS